MALHCRLHAEMGGRVQRLGGDEGLGRRCVAMQLAPDAQRVVGHALAAAAAVGLQDAAVVAAG